MARIEHLSQLLNAPVYAASGERIGRVSEIAASGDDDQLPLLSSLCISTHSGSLWAPLDACELRPGSVRLKQDVDVVGRPEPPDGAILMHRDLLDKQIVDVHDHRVVRVNDVWLAPLRSGWGVVGVEADLRSLMRRIGAETLLSRLTRALHIRPDARIIRWQDVEQLTHSGGIKLKVAYNKIARLNPADIADIVEQLDPVHRDEVIDALDLETAAETLAEAEPEVQTDILTRMDTDKAADLLEEMEPDEAADILQDLPKGRSEDLLAEMEPDEADDVKQLLEYDEGTAGGMMTTEYVAFYRRISAAEALERLRAEHSEAETIYYVYVTDDDGVLQGVLSLRELIMAPPDQPLEALMESDVKTADPDDDEDTVHESLAKYNLLALPVVDSRKRLLGIVTVDDAMDRLVDAKEYRRKASQRDD